jgi:RNA-binding protein
LKQGQTVQSVEISTIAHATDDLEKVESTLTRLLPESLKSRQIFTRRYLQGHYGNPIVTFEAHLNELTDVDEFKTFFVRQLAQADRATILRDIDRHTDTDGNLYIRIDKQKMFRGTAGLGQDDPIRIRMKFTKFTGKTSALMIEYLESA